MIIIQESSISSDVSQEMIYIKGASKMMFTYVGSEMQKWTLI